MEDISFVIFRDGKHFFQKILKKNFGHVSVLKRDDFNWYVIEPYNNRLMVKILPFAADNDLPLMNYIHNDEVKVVKVVREVSDRKVFSYSFFHFMNCVSVCKYTLGIKNKCITPYSLYKWLKNSCLKQGIVEVEIF